MFAAHGWPFSQKFELCSSAKDSALSPFPILYLSDSHRQAGSAMRGYSLNMGNNEFYGMSKIGKGGRIYWSVTGAKEGF